LTSTLTFTRPYFFFFSSLFSANSPYFFVFFFLSPFSSSSSLAAFYGAAKFNQDISKWDVSKVTDMQSMFNFATSFNIDLSHWNLASLRLMGSMFNSATKFDQSLCGISWITTPASSGFGMFSSSAGSIATTICSCNPGQYMYGNTCRTCQPGEYQDDPIAQECKVCKDKVSFFGASKCTVDCPAGSFASSSTVCSPCPAGTSSAETGLTASTPCKACADGEHSTAGMIACTAGDCPAGTYLDASKCVGCPAGKISKVGGKMTIEGCDGACPVGKYSDETGLESNSKCMVCPPGSYNDETGQSSCVNCPIGRFNYISLDEVPYDLARRHNSLADCLM